LWDSANQQWQRREDGCDGRKVRTQWTRKWWRWVFVGGFEERLRRVVFNVDTYCTLLCNVCDDQGIVCLIDLLNEFEFWLALDSQNILALFIDQLRRKHAERTRIEKTSDQMNASMASVETNEKGEVSGESVEGKSGEQLFHGKFCER
jgi:hypothetical protein